jgi:hypothetical protein
MYQDWDGSALASSSSTNVPSVTASTTVDDNNNNLPTTSSSWHSILQSGLECHSEWECIERAKRILSPETLLLWETLQRKLQCHSFHDCLRVVLDKEESTPSLKHDSAPLESNERSEPDELLEDAQQKSKVDREILMSHVQEALDRSQRDPVDEYGTSAPFLDSHPAFVPLLDEYRPRDEWRNVNVPDLNVVGLFKAGTTHLYSLLESHPLVTNFAHGKEVCSLRFGRGFLWEDWEPTSIVRFDEQELTKRRSEAQKGVYKSHEAMYAEQVAKNISTEYKTVNGCLLFETVEMSTWYLRPLPPRKKFFFLFRDPADWLWAAHNYWRQHNLDLDTRPDTRQWAFVNREYRSPELFHEFVASGNRTTGGVHLLNLRKWTVNIPRRLRAMVGDGNALFLRNEDMLPAVMNTPGGALDRISEIAGLNKTGFDKKYTTQIFNCNQRKGVKKLGCGSERTSAYLIAGNRTMLPETRRLIYLQFWEECKIWAKEFGIVYPDCLNVMDDISAEGS